MRQLGVARRVGGSRRASPCPRQRISSARRSLTWTCSTTAWRSSSRPSRTRSRGACCQEGTRGIESVQCVAANLPAVATPAPSTVTATGSSHTAAPQIKRPVPRGAGLSSCLAPQPTIAPSSLTLTRYRSPTPSTPGSVRPRPPSGVSVYDAEWRRAACVSPSRCPRRVREVGQGAARPGRRHVRRGPVA